MLDQTIDEDLYRQAAAFVVGEQKASTSFIQKKLGIGYNKAARLIERMEEQGIVSAANHVGKREVASVETIRAAIDLSELMGCQDQGEPRMKETSEDKAVRDNVYGVAACELKSFVERYERLEIEKKEVAEQMKEVMAEAKGRGYDTKILRKVIALRKRDKDDIAEEEAVLEMYKAALGME